MRLKTGRRRSERRENPRADARLSMRVESVPHEEPLTQLVTESQNISASGVYCTSPQFLSPLSKIALTIVLPTVPGTRGRQELIKCEGIVVRCQPVAKRGERRFELACMFSELDARRRALIAQYVTWRNLQALRAAAGGLRSRATARRSVGARAAASPSRAARPARKAPARRRSAT